jgi:murein DD-endopeptidase MepM/ murein hydrolase activator NlpD|tara:strand:- start:11393 stop:12697 length:1305 start_codon:yes stop_codon:yes gene_type:complete
MLVTEIITIFKNFPKKHILTILLGFLLLVLLSALGSKDLSERKKPYELTKPLTLNALSDNYKIEVPHIEKEAVIKRNDSLFTILNNLGVAKENIIQLINSKKSDLLSKIEVGDKIRIYLSDSGELEELIYIDNIKSGINAKKDGASFLISRYESKIEKVKVFKHVVIKDSMYMSGLRENVPDSVLMDLAYINGWDIDFTHDIQPGDSFSIVYEELIIDGEKVIDGDILISEFNNRDKKFIAIRYDLDEKNSEYFNLNGENVKKAFLRSPVKLSYISSKYNLKRRHPVLHTIRAHKGVDYAAKKGSPIRATGDGTILFAAYNGGCGYEVKIKHSEDYETRYCHLEGFSARTKVGRKIKQGQTIGYVGSTGLATGPHLHYEFHVNGKHTDPLKVKFPNAAPINSSELNAYKQRSSSLVSELKNYQYLIDKRVFYGG